MALARISTWEQALADYLAKTHAMAHHFGRHDCLIDCANAVKAMTSHDFARGHRGKYKSAASSSVYLRSLGFDSPEAMIDSLLPVKPAGFAQRGDIVLAVDEEAFGHPGGVPGICIGGDALFIADSGRVRLPRTLWVKAWAV